MTAFDVVSTLGEMGVMFRQAEIDSALDYFAQMLAQRRIILICKDGTPHAILTFAVSDEPWTFYRKKTWEYRPHSPNGKTIYIEMLVAKDWTKQLRSDFETAILKSYPQIETGIWHRWSKWGDRKVMTRRRLECTK